MKRRPCTVCGKQFQKPSQLQRHFRIHTGEKPFKCSQCEKSFNQKVTLDSHVKSQHDKVRPFTCTMCKCTFSQRGNLRAHLKNVHVTPNENEKSFKCEECPCVFRRLATLNTHISKAHSVSSLQNDGDNSISTLVPKSNEEQTFSSELQVKFAHEENDGIPKTHLVNVKKVGDEKLHMCNHCPKSFKKPSDLIRHIRIHTFERPYKCDLCFKAFAVKTTLSTHLQIHANKKKWKCSICFKTFSLLPSLKDHKRLHGCLKQYKCSEDKCEKSFKTSCQRRAHSQVHKPQFNLGLKGKRKLLQIGNSVAGSTSGKVPDALKITEHGLVPVPPRSASVEDNQTDSKSRPYRCSQCPSAFKKSSHLKQHLLTHSGEKPFQCFQCSRRFVSSGVLKNHIRTHGGIRPHRCDICYRSFSTRGSLKRHTFTHSSSRLYLCPICKKPFKTNVSCRKHIKIHGRRKELLSTNSYPVKVLSTSRAIEVGGDGRIPTGTGGGAAKLSSSEGTLNGYANSQIPEEAVLSGPPLIRGFIISSDNLVSERDDYMEMDAQQLNYPLEGEFNVQTNLVVPTVELQQGSFPIQDVIIPISSSLPPSYTNGAINFQEPATVPTRLATAEPEKQLAQAESDTQKRLDLPQGSSAKSLQSETEVGTTSMTILSSTSTQADLVLPPAASMSMPAKGKSETDLNMKTKSAEDDIFAKSPVLPPLSKRNECPTCKKTFKKGSDLIRHIRIHTGEKPFRCSVCGKSFRVKSTRDAHMRIHQEKKTVKCDICHKLFATLSSLKLHIRLHTGEKPYECHLCDKSFRTTGHMQAHLKTHLKQNSAKKTAKPGTRTTFNACQKEGNINGSENCGRNNNYPTLSGIDQVVHQLETNDHIQDQLGPNCIKVLGNLHLSAENLQNIQITSLDDGNSFQTEDFLQGFVFISQPEVLSDANRCFEINPSLSSVIPSSSSPVPSVSGAMPIPCMDSFTRKDPFLPLAVEINPNTINADLTSEYSHDADPRDESKTSSRPGIDEKCISKECPDCGKKFSKPSHMLRHRRIHTGEKPHVCKFCCNTFNQKSSLDTHVMFTHSDVRRFQCPLPECPFKTVQKGALKKHCARAHPQLNWADVMKGLRSH